MATNKDYYEECKKILETIDKLLKESKEFKDLTQLFNDFADEHNPQKDEDEKQLSADNLFRRKQRVQKDKKCTLSTLKCFKELYEFMLGSLNQYAPLENRDFENKILGEKLADEIEAFVCELENLKTT